jgi:hypothetical protein
MMAAARSHEEYHLLLSLRPMICRRSAHHDTEVATPRKSPSCCARASTLAGRSFMLVITVLTFGLAVRGVRAGLPANESAWAGKFVRLISPEEERQLGSDLRVFFGNSTGNAVSSALVPGVSPSLFNQFSAVDYGFRMWQYRLPSGQLIWDRSDGRSGVDAVVVSKGTGSVPIAAAAFLTHLCPKNGLTETFWSRYGGTFQTRVRCESDYSLMIFYPRGASPNSNLNADLTRWAKASIGTRLPATVQPVRKPALKVFVRVLGK